MLLNFEMIPETVIPRFHGGEKEARSHMFRDADNKIMIGLLAPGASIGRHVHETNSEIVYIVSGRGKAWFDDTVEELVPGLCHYCPRGHEHGMFNDGEENLVIFSVIPEHVQAE